LRRERFPPTRLGYGDIYGLGQGRGSWALPEERLMRYWRKPLDMDQVKIPHGRVVIIADRCKGCKFCVEYCPKEVLIMSEDFNSKGYHPPEVVLDGECVNCNLCEMICPDFAIFCVAEDDDATAESLAAKHAPQIDEEEGGPN
jgi:2-oxoglutarate ferredoxin oxidoreductase subunit delta